MEELYRVEWQEKESQRSLTANAETCYLKIRDLERSNLRGKMIDLETKDVVMTT